ncbi:hypothetical protein EJB05_31590 [Eragrostis curvula]|uniref:Factor of DNA methylation 1-5/IDN2 domain-containing protein n=1 Tax=Eragrostis curvula TaxID=38414 RepID=A0A5J9UDX6_9POAL|nr:hypothetical protein EJB05_31590 [Eragrostis curvula]
MAPAGKGDEKGGGSCGVGPKVNIAGAGQNLGAEAGIRKRKAEVMSRDCNNLAEKGEGFEVECEDHRRISMEIENLRSQLDKAVEELGYCEENEKLSVEMDRKDTEMQCLRKQNEELQAKYGELLDNYEKQNEALQIKYEKQKEYLQDKYDKQIEEMQAKYEKHKYLQSKYEMQEEKQQGKYENLNKELRPRSENKKEGLRSTHEKHKEELQAKQKQQNKELQPKHEGLHKKILEMLENQIHAKRKQLQQLAVLYSTMEFPLTHLEEGKRIPDKSYGQDSASKLVDESSVEKSVVNGKADDEKKLRLELEVAKLDAEIEIRMERLGDMLESEKFSEELSSLTVWKSVQANMELQDIRKGLMAALEDVLPRYMNIGVKRMGEINYLSIRRACLQKYRKDEAEKAIMASFWSEELGKPSWHPFKIVEIDGRLKEVINDDDAKLKLLRNEFGDDACNSVKTALMEMNEYNPSERHAVPEFWNFGRGRKATVEEILKFVLSQLRKTPRRA